MKFHVATVKTHVKRIRRSNSTGAHGRVVEASSELVKVQRISRKPGLSRFRAHGFRPYKRIKNPSPLHTKKHTLGRLATADRRGF